MRARFLAVAGTAGYTPVEGHWRGFTLRRRRIPVWAIVLAVVLFPLGLLFLLARTEEVVTVTLDPVPQGTRVTVVGGASSRLQYGFQAAMARYEESRPDVPESQAWPEAGGMGLPPSPPPPPPRRPIPPPVPQLGGLPGGGQPGGGLPGGGPPGGVAPMPLGGQLPAPPGGPAARSAPRGGAFPPLAPSPLPGAPPPPNPPDDPR